MKVLVSGLLALAAAMGIGRFAYTPILPLMKSGAGLTDSFAGLLAASNYLGYLLGALWSARPIWRAYRVAAIKWSLIAGLITVPAMAFAQNDVLWLLARFVSGAASAFTLILVSSVILDRASKEGHRSWPGILYTGVGIGMVLSGILIPIVEHDGWRASWYASAALFALLVIPALVWMREDAATPGQEPRSVAKPAYNRGFWALMAAYCGQGIGYIIPATFIVVVLRATPGVGAIAAFAWIVVGLIATPSTLLWNRLASRFGTRPMLCSALLLSACGVVAPLYAPNAFGAIFAAFALGATFMGVTVLVNLEARARFPQASHRAIGDLTASLGIGQILGPLLVSALAIFHGGYPIALIVACVVLVLSAGASLVTSPVR